MEESYIHLGEGMCRKRKGGMRKAKEKGMGLQLALLSLLGGVSTLWKRKRKRGRCESVDESACCVSVPV
jgi:hypothetical protein